MAEVEVGYEQGRRLTPGQAERLKPRLGMAQEYLRTGQDWLLSRVVAEAAEIMFGPRILSARIGDGVRSEAARQLADVRGRAILGTSKRSGPQAAYRAADAAEVQWRRDNPWMSELIGPRKFPENESEDSK